MALPVRAGRGCSSANTCLRGDSLRRQTSRAPAAFVGMRARRCIAAPVLGSTAASGGSGLPRGRASVSSTELVPSQNAQVHIDDRAYTFRRRVLRGLTVSDGKFVDEGPHLVALTVPYASRIARRRCRASRSVVLFLVLSRGLAPQSLVERSPSICMCRGPWRRATILSEDPQAQFVAWPRPWRHSRRLTSRNVCGRSRAPTTLDLCYIKVDGVARRMCWPSRRRAKPRRRVVVRRGEGR